MDDKELKEKLDEFKTDVSGYEESVLGVQFLEAMKLTVTLIPNFFNSVYRNNGGVTFLRDCGSYYSEFEFNEDGTNKTWIRIDTDLDFLHDNSGSEIKTVINFLRLVDNS